MSTTLRKHTGKTGQHRMRSRLVRSRTDKGQSFQDAFAEQGVQFPLAPETPPEPGKDRRVDFPLRPQRRGVFRPGYGWQAVGTPQGRVYRSTTDQVGGVFPFLTASPMPKQGAPLGYVAATATGFYVDPWQWVQLGLVSNPNLMIQGKPGQGKSGTVKAIIRRALRHGARAFVPGDLKDEYVLVCKEWGVTPWQVGPGMPTRINPLDPGPLAANWRSLSQQTRDERWVDIRARWLVLLEGLLGAQDVAVTSTVQTAIAAVVDELTGAAAGGGNVTAVPDIIIPQVWKAAYDPSDHLLKQLRYDSERDYYADLRPMVTGLNVLVNGALKGMFDDHTTIDVDWNAPIQSLSMKRLKEMADDKVIGVALTCANSWVSGMTAVNPTGQPIYIPRDEVWRVMRLGVNAVKSLDSNLRLSRDERKIEMLIMHKPSDLSSVGAAGSQEAAIAEDFWALCDTKVSLGHDKTIAQTTGEKWGLSSQEQAAIAGWCRRKKGRALWRIGDHSLRVETMLAPHEEKYLFNTNDRTDYGESQVAASTPDAGDDATTENEVS